MEEGRLYLWKGFIRFVSLKEPGDQQGWSPGVIAVPELRPQSCSSNCCLVVESYLEEKRK